MYHNQDANRLVPSSEERQVVCVHNSGTFAAQHSAYGPPYT